MVDMKEEIIEALESMIEEIRDSKKGFSPCVAICQYNREEKVFKNDVHYFAD